MKSSLSPDTFRGKVEPGAERCLLRILPENEDYTIPGTGLRLWLPRPSSHEGFTCEVSEPTPPYIDRDTGAQYQAQYKKGDIVVIGKFTGATITLNRDKYVVCRERDILCRIIPEEDLPASATAVSS